MWPSPLPLLPPCLTLHFFNQCSLWGSPSFFYILVHQKPCPVLDRSVCYNDIVYTQLTLICFIIVYLCGLSLLSASFCSLLQGSLLLCKLPAFIDLLESIKFFPLFQLPLIGMPVPTVHLAMMKASYRSQSKCRFLRKVFNESYN